jgi:hypothetical protein|tara:strand:+ start:366 stop:614 length:249 start_codon:yes stop_codon:yes gene_type:complete
MSDVVTDFDDMIFDIQEVAMELVADMRPLFDPKLRKKRLSSFLKKLDGEGLDRFLTRCGHKQDGPCNCQACSSFAQMILKVN